MLGQTFAPGDLATIAVLVILEGVLSLDNALVLGLLASRLKTSDRMAALSYGLIGALIFRLIMVAAAAYLLRWSILKLIGGAYLVWVAAKYFIFHRHHSKNKQNEIPQPQPGFWPTVLAIELTDVAFAIDSILAAVALVGPAPPQTPIGAIHPKLWVILTGGMLGVILMRFAAALFIRLLNRFPRLNLSAYLLVLLIGAKLIIDWLANSPASPNRIDFQNPASVPFWIFWLFMLLSLAAGFLPAPSSSESSD